jgi:hypothetical protein
MLELIFPLNIRSLPLAKCLKHECLNISISPVLTETSGKLTAVWACPVCESEGEKGTGGSYLLDTNRRVTLRE